MEYYSQYHSHELFELQESLSGLSKSNRIVSIYQPHLRPIVRGKAKVEFGAKIGASIVNGYTYVDHLSWDAYNESSDLAMQLELYKKRFGMLPQEVQADKLYSGRRTGILSRQEEGHRREERGGGHIRNLQKGLPGKRHQGET